MITVLVADDSLTVRKRIVELIENDPKLMVVGEASNGKEAQELAGSTSPDIVVMDLVMPLMDGLEATEHIMAKHPMPILIHSSAQNRGEDYKTIDALSAGALDFVEKGCDNWEEEIIFRIKRASKIKVVTHRRKRKQEKSIPGTSATRAANKYDLVVMGASTGGPKIVLDILRRLPATFPIPIIIVIHLTDNFRNSMAEWLQNNTALDIITPAGMELYRHKKGTAYIAPPGRHLIIENGNIKLISSPLVHFCRPSVDVLFESVAADNRQRAIAVLLSGMGRDGAAGLMAIKKSGGYTIAQDKSTSVVFGMPKEAIEMGAAMAILPDTKIPNEIMKLVKCNT